MEKYHGVRIPDDLIREIDKIIEQSPWGYKSRSEFVKEAIREKIQSLLKIN
jgi:metal-responsive CopG/Arc/MetJ family transcriptional regulator